MIVSARMADLETMANLRCSKPVSMCFVLCDVKYLSEQALVLLLITGSFRSP